MSVLSDYERIDRIRSVSGMLRALQLLEDPQPVILLGLERSRCQFTWSHFAKRLKVPENLWPPNPNLG